MDSVDPIFSVIIPVYNDWDPLKSCLNAFENQSLKPEKYEILIVDNHSSINVSSKLDLPDNTRVLHQPKPGSYAARNLGIRSSRGTYLAFTDADCIPDSDWLKNALQLFQEKSCSLIGGNVKVTKKNNANFTVYLYEKQFMFQQQETVKKGESVTANLIVKKDVLNVVGLFDETII
jgi:glycosyltransferase involved in cell wall biosynthesis